MTEKLSDAELLAKIQELKGQGMSHVAIAKEMSISEMTVYRVLQEFRPIIESSEQNDQAR